MKVQEMIPNYEIIIGDELLTPEDKELTGHGLLDDLPGDLAELMEYSE